MAATFTFAESYATIPTVVDPATFLNFLATNTASGSDATTNTAAAPIVTTGSTVYSYERWFRGHWVSTFTSVTSILFQKSAGTIPGTITVNAKNIGTSTYATAVNTLSAGTANITTNGTTVSDSSTLTSAGYSYYFVMQLTVPTGSTQGNIGTQTWQMGWNEV